MILVSSVNFNVFWQVTFVNKSLVTMCTRLWFHPEVNLHVAIQWTFADELFVALSTCEFAGTDTFMHSGKMHFQFCRRYKCAFTFIAVVIFFTWMSFVVFSLLRPGIHCDFSLRARKGFVSSIVFLFVNIFQVEITGEWLVTVAAGKTFAIVSDISMIL